MWFEFYFEMHSNLFMIILLYLMTTCYHIASLFLSCIHLLLLPDHLLMASHRNVRQKKKPPFVYVVLLKAKNIAAAARDGNGDPIPRGEFL
jgi:hypothetical protein